MTVAVALCKGISLVFSLNQMLTHDCKFTEYFGTRIEQRLLATTAYIFASQLLHSAMYLITANGDWRVGEAISSTTLCAVESWQMYRVRRCHKGHADFWMEWTGASAKKTPHYVCKNTPQSLRRILKSPQLVALHSLFAIVNLVLEWSQLTQKCSNQSFNRTISCLTLSSCGCKFVHPASVISVPQQKHSWGVPEVTYLLSHIWTASHHSQIKLAPLSRLIQSFALSLTFYRFTRSTSK